MFLEFEMDAFLYRNLRKQSSRSLGASELQINAFLIGILLKVERQILEIPKRCQKHQPTILAVPRHSVLRTLA